MQNIQTTYPVMEMFYTIQGEGYFQGKAAYFIRLAGCDVGCVWCDVKESWDSSQHPTYTTDAILQQVLNDLAQHQLQHTKPVIVITGGEPYMHNLTSLIGSLQQNGFQVNIETSAAHPFSGKADWICVSPKKFKAPIFESLQYANELKVVIYHPSDFAWAQTFLPYINSNCKLYLQPEWSKRETITPLIVDFVKQNPNWTLCLQVHKYIHVP